MHSRCRRPLTWYVWSHHSYNEVWSKTFSILLFLLNLSNLFFSGWICEEIEYSTKKEKNSESDEDSSDEDDDVTETKTEGFEEKT